MFGFRMMYIDGRLRESAGGGRRKVFCPATDDVVGEVAWANAEDTEAALKSADRAFPVWSRSSLNDRVAHMMRLRELVIEHEEILRESERQENGKTWEQTEEGFIALKDSLEFYAGEIKRLQGHVLPDTSGEYEHRICYHSAGVVGAFIAWNHPMLNLAFKMGPAMAAGCPIILRPADDTPLTAYLIGELCEKAGLPSGVVNIIAGPVSETAELITGSRIPAMLTLIGSTRTGLSIMKNGATSVKRYSMEMGGNAPALVFSDADLDRAADIITLLKFINAGQICVSPNRVFVHEDVHDAFVEKVLEKTRAIRPGFGRDSGAGMGPLINKRSRERVDALVKSAVAAGARLLYGGSIPEDLKDRGAFYMPTVLDDVPDSVELSCEEVFGPVLSIKTFRDFDEVIRRANDTDMGLASYVFSRDADTIRRASMSLEFGEVQVNGVKYGIDLPHIGIKQSGIGQDCSHFALEEYLVTKRISTAVEF